MNQQLAKQSDRPERVTIASCQLIGLSPISQTVVDIAIAETVFRQLRVSQINGCAYCCNLHRNEAVKLGVNQDKIESLYEFTASSLFSGAEKEALQWAESLTRLDGNKKVCNTELSKYFGEREIVDITICISLMNAFNRLAISMRDV